MKANYIPQKKAVVVKRFFGEGDSNLKLVAKEAKMLQNLRHPKVAEFVAVCSKPVAIMMEYKMLNVLRSIVIYDCIAPRCFRCSPGHFLFIT